MAPAGGAPQRRILATRVLGAVVAASGLVAFTCHVAVPVEAGGGSVTLAEVTSTYGDVGIAVHLLVLAALGLAAALRPAIGARTIALGGIALPWLAGRVARLWADGAPTAMRVLAVAVLVALVAVVLALVVGFGEVRWAAGGVLLGDGLSVLVVGAVLWALLGLDWYRVRELSADTLLPGRFGAELDTATGGGRIGWVAVVIAVVAVAVAVTGGGWARRAAGTVVVGICLFEAVRRVFLSGERAFSSFEQANPFGAMLSAEPVLVLLVVPLVGAVAGAWFVTTGGDVVVDDDPDAIREPDPRVGPVGEAPRP